LPPKGYETLPLNSPKDTSCGEVVEEENYSDTRSDATPLIEHPKKVIVIVQQGVVSPITHWNETFDLPSSNKLIHIFDHIHEWRRLLEYDGCARLTIDNITIVTQP
jgi:hypothetical protein